MNNFKKFVAVFLLSAVSICVIFLPRVIKMSENRSLLKRQQSWTYTGRASVGITATQVAELYCNSELDNIYSLSMDMNTSEREQMKESTLTLFGNIFGEESVVTAFLRKEFEGADYVDYNKQSVLAVIDDHAVVLNLISVNSTNLYMIYEEKTQTVISFTFISPTDTLISVTGAEESEVKSAVEKYYDGILEGTPYSYYFFNRTNLWDGIESEAYDHRFTDFGLLKSEKEYTLFDKG